MFETPRTLLRYRGLLFTLTRRELVARYRGSALGFLWSLVNPLLLAGVYTLVFGIILSGRAQLLAGGAGPAQPYVLFLMVGLFPWIWASSTILEGTVCLSANAGLIRKAVFPVQVLPIVSVCSQLTHFALALPILLAALLIGRALGYQVLSLWSLLLPSIVLLELVMLAGVALGLAALSVHFKDVRDLVANVLQLLFFMSPILYRVEGIGYASVRTVIKLNPFTPFTEAFQTVLLLGVPPSWPVWLHMVALGAVAWVGGGWLFRRLEDTLVEAV